MSNLLNHPKSLHKLTKELDTQVGPTHLLNEDDLPKLPSLQNIISETLRLHPATPLLIPHVSSSGCVIDGYDVPSDTVLLVNSWAIHRDPKVWDEAMRFRPERFESGEVYERHKLMPFGLGRRACPGEALGQRIVRLTLGVLVQCFEWRRVGDVEIDMSEGGGLTMPKARPLVACCKARPVVDTVLG